MTHSLLVVVLMVVGVSYGRQWTNVDELEDYLTNNYDESLGFEADTSDSFLMWHESRYYHSQLPKMWPSGIVPYHVDGKPSKKQMSSILDAMRVIENVSCLKFKPSKQQDKLTIRVDMSGDSGLCNSHVGYFKSGMTMNLGKRCFVQEVIIHELLHTLGMHHQHCASNRDDYVTIHWDNIHKDNQYAFEKESEDLPAEKEFGYDYESIMHYSFDTYAIDGRYPSMSAKDPTVQLLRNSKMSHKDIKKLNRMYNCIKQ